MSGPRRIGLIVPSSNVIEVVASVSESSGITNGASSG